jgi:hypothetical protein
MLDRWLAGRYAMPVSPNGKEQVMKRNLKSLCIAIVAVLAMSAVVASAASAAAKHHFTSPKTGTLSVVNNSTQKFEATTGEGNFKSCNKFTFTVGTNPTTGDSLTVLPDYSECIFKKGETESVANVNESECAYEFKGETTPGNLTGGEHANLIIEDISGDGVCHIHTTVTAFNLKCVSVPNQTIKHAVRYAQVDENTIRFEITAHSVTSTTTNSIACPTASGGTEVHTEGGLYTGTVDVRSTVNGKAQKFTLQQNVTP